LPFHALLAERKRAGYGYGRDIAIDKKTGEVIVASATCVAQAGNTHRNQMTVFEELKKGTDPATIIEIPSNDNPILV
jgi:hypothetical protein